MIRLKKVKLNKGANLYYAKNKISNITQLSINFPSGAQCDGKLAGLAHFVEHMFFTGTDTLTKEQVWKEYNYFVNTNASTDGRFINFVGRLFNKELPSYLDLVSQMITHSPFTDESIEKEKKVVKQEIVRSKDDYAGQAYRNLLYNIYRRDNYKLSTLGSEETVDRITRDDVVAFVGKYFVANNCTVIISSPYSLGKIKSILNKHLIANLPQNEALQPLSLRKEKCVDTTFFNYKVADIKKTYFNVGFTFDADYRDYEFYIKLELLLDMMNGAEGISKTMRIERSLVYDSGFYYYINDKDCMLVFDTNMDKRNLKDVQQTLAEYIVNIRENGFTEEQFKQAKRLYDHGREASEPKVDRLMRSLRGYWINDFKVKSKVAKKIRDKFTLDEANSMIKSILSSVDIAMTTYGNADKADSYTKAQFKKLFK